VPTTTQPNLSDLSQKETVLWHLRNYAEIDRDVADEEYDIGRLAARIRDLKDDGYQFETWKEDGIAHYSLVGEPVEDEREPENGPISVQTAEDLWRALPEGSLARDYVAFLARCAQGEETVGVLEETLEPEAVSDWEAAAFIDRDVTVGAITECREKLCRESPFVVPAGHRKGKETYRLHPSLI
jgi:hypothetical protein